MGWVWGKFRIKLIKVDKIIQSVLYSIRLKEKIINYVAPSIEIKGKNEKNETAPKQGNFNRLAHF